MKILLFICVSKSVLFAGNDPVGSYDYLGLFDEKKIPKMYRARFKDDPKALAGLQRFLDAGWVIRNDYHSGLHDYYPSKNKPILWISATEGPFDQWISNYDAVSQLHDALSDELHPITLMDETLNNYLVRKSTSGTQMAFGAAGAVLSVPLAAAPVPGARPGSLILFVYSVDSIVDGNSLWNNRGGGDSPITEGLGAIGEYSNGKEGRAFATKYANLSKLPAGFLLPTSSVKPLLNIKSSLSASQITFRKGLQVEAMQNAGYINLKGLTSAQLDEVAGYYLNNYYYKSLSTPNSQKGLYGAVILNSTDNTFVIKDSFGVMNSNQYIIETVKQIRFKNPGLGVNLFTKRVLPGQCGECQAFSQMFPGKTVVSGDLHMLPIALKARRAGKIGTPCPNCLAILGDKVRVIK